MTRQQVFDDGKGDRARKHEQRVDQGSEEVAPALRGDGEPDQGDQRSAAD